MNAKTHILLALSCLTLMQPAPTSGQQVVALPTADRILPVQSQPLYSIGGADAPEWATFSGVTAAGFDGQGRLHILDGRNRRVVVVDEGGRLVRQFGRRGNGPGEFQAARAMAVFPDGRVAVLDVLRRRVAIFQPDGSLITEEPSDLGEGTLRTIAASGPRGLVGDIRVYIRNGQPMDRSGGSVLSDRPVQRFRLGTEWRPEVQHRARLRVSPTNEQGLALLTAYMHEFGLTTLPDGRLVVSDTGAYLLTVVDTVGVVQRVLRRPLPDRPVTAADRSREKDRRLADLAAGKMPTSTVSFGGSRPSREELERRARRTIEAMAFPASFPHVASLAADPDGRIWVERVGEPGQPGPIDLLTPDGGYVGTLAPDEPGMPVAVGPGGLAAYVDLDEDNVPTVRVVRLTIPR